MAGLLLPMLLDAMGGGYSGYQEMAHMTLTAQDSLANSNVWNTQGPSANHGSINFNFHVNNENFYLSHGVEFWKSQGLSTSGTADEPEPFPKEYPQPDCAEHPSKRIEA